jgi:hypothetical protein
MKSLRDMRRLFFIQMPSVYCLDKRKPMHTCPAQEAHDARAACRCKIV